MRGKPGLERGVHARLPTWPSSPKTVNDIPRQANGDTFLGDTSLGPTIGRSIKFGLHRHKRDLADSLLEGTEMSARLGVEEMMALLKEAG